MGSRSTRKRSSARASTPALVARLGSNRFAVSGHPPLRFAPDGARLVSMGTCIGLWDIASGERTAWTSCPPTAGKPTFSHDGSRLLVPCSREVLVLDARTLATLHSWPAPNDAPGGGDEVVAWGESALVVAALHGRVMVWEAASGRVVARLTGNGRTLALAPDGARLAVVPVAEDGPCTVHDVATGALLATTEGPGAGAAAFSPDGERLVVGGQSGHLRVYHARTGRRLHEILAHPQGWVRGVRFVGETLFTWGTDNSIRRCELGPETSLLRTLGVIAVPYGGLHGALSDDGRHYADAHGGVIVVRRTDGDAPRITPSAPRLRGVTDVELSADHTHALIRKLPGSTRVWHVTRAEAVFEHAALAIHGAREPDAGYFALAADPSRLLRFTLAGAAQATNGATGSTTGWPCVAPDGSFWVDVLNGRLRCFDATGRLRWERQESRGDAPLFARDGRSLVYCPCDTQGFPLRAQVHRADTGDVLAQVRLRRGTERVAAVSHDGSRLALFVENGLRVVAPATSAKAVRVNAKVAVVVAAFAPDGASIAFGTYGGEVCLADCATGRIRTRWTAHCARVTALAFSRDDTRLISGSDDGSGAVWLLSDAAPLTDEEPPRARTEGLSSVKAV